MPPVQYKAEKSGEATERTKDNKEICEGKERTIGMSRWFSESGKHRFYRQDSSKSIPAEQREKIVG